MSESVLRMRARLACSWGRRGVGGERGLTTGRAADGVAFHRLRGGDDVPDAGYSLEEDGPRAVLAEPIRGHGVEVDGGVLERVGAEGSGRW